jgi:hypothetical protein
MTRREQDMETGIETYRKLRMMVIAAADVAALTEIVLAMYQAVNSRDDLTSAFVSSFFAMFLPTIGLVIAALVLLRLRYGKAARAAAQAAAALPDDGGLVV